ncbi:MAG: alcohol dehydrogenase catalytic domain-containing protein, partial [Planctomycetaceae bacterium]
MKAAFIERTGPPEVIRHGDLPEPVAGPGQALVRVRACAVNPIDTYVRAGTVAMPLPSPFVVGCDLAGEVVAVGPGTAGLEPGDRVWGSNQGLLGRQGVCAEFAAVDARWLYHTPGGVSDRDAAAGA